MLNRDNPVDSSLDFTFTITINVSGKPVDMDLKPNGKNINVTDENKKEYLRFILRDKHIYLKFCLIFLLLFKV